MPLQLTFFHLELLSIQGLILVDGFAIDNFPSLKSHLISFLSHERFDHTFTFSTFWIKCHFSCPNSPETVWAHFKEAFLPEFITFFKYVYGELYLAPSLYGMFQNSPGKLAATLLHYMSTTKTSPPVDHQLVPMRYHEGNGEAPPTNYDVLEKFEEEEEPDSSQRVNLFLFFAFVYSLKLGDFLRLLPPLRLALLQVSKEAPRNVDFSIASELVSIILSLNQNLPRRPESHFTCIIHQDKFTEMIIDFDRIFLKIQTLLASFKKDDSPRTEKSTMSIRQKLLVSKLVSLIRSSFN